MNKKNNSIIALFIGALCGFVNGFFGGGGGMIIVPALIFLMGFRQKNAHATSIAIILPVTVASAVIYLFNVKTDWLILSVCAVGITIGGIIGAILLKKTANRVVAYIFCALMAAAGVKMLFF